MTILKLKAISRAALITLALAGGVAWAEDAPKAPAEKTPNRALTLDNVGGGLTPEQRKQAEETARLISSSAQSSLQDKKAQEIAAAAQTMARRVDDIADRTLAEDREKVLKFLGINPNGDSALYYFVSFEMPIEVLRSYVVEAMWAGGTLVFRGVPPDRDFKDFLTKDLQSLVYGKGASASLSIDPRLFDAYQVTAVPTIVYTEDRRNLQCRGMNPKEFDYQKSTHTYDTCPPVPDDKYWKMSGAVTSDYALREFISHGAKRAQPFHDALAKGLAMGMAAPKGQQPFSGEWKPAVTPEELMSIQQAIETAKKMGTGVPAAAPGK